MHQFWTFVAVFVVSGFPNCNFLNYNLMAPAATKQRPTRIGDC